jgi:Zn ribbon nucleic-acid-binding protein
MARQCVKCGKPVRFLVALSSSTRGQGPLCPECAAEERNAKWERERIETEQRQAAIVAAEEKRKSIVAEIQASKKLSPAGVQWLRSLSKDKAKDFYEVAYALFNTDSHMEVQELTTLWNIQNVARLSPRGDSL